MFIKKEAKSEIIKERLKKQIYYISKKSKFYIEKLKHFNLQKHDIIYEFDFLPFTNKLEILYDQNVYPPFGSNLCVNVDKIKRIHKTSGTTNRPLLIALTDTDIKTTVDVGAKCFISAGVKPKDIVVHCLNYNMWAGGYTDHQCLEATGAAVIPFGVGNSKGLIETILLIKPTAIHCTPSYLAKLELILKESFNLKASKLNLKLGLFGGESGLQNKEFRNNIEKTWGLKAMNANYGMADVLSIFGAECLFQDGLHFMAQNIIYPELINHKTEKVLPIETGVIGELVVTHLRKEAQPLLRYRTNDIIKILSKNKCNCGQTGFRFEILGRSDDMLNIKGVNVFVSAIDDAINNHLNILTGIYQILISKADPIDRIILKIEVRANNSLSNEILANLIRIKFKERLGIKPEITLENEGTLSRTEEKSKKIFRIL